VLVHSRHNVLSVVLAVTAAAAIVATLLVAGLTASSSAARATPVPFPRQPRGLAAPVAQPSGAEQLSGYFGQVSCNPKLMPGVRMLRDLALRTYGRGHDGGVTRSCVSGGTSEHKEGRAWDWMLNVNQRRDRRAAADFLAWLTAPGRDGLPGLQARRLGVMYVIYNKRIWASYRPQWLPYDGYSPHTDHIHLSFGWAGARGRTSFWTGRVAGTDYGPCSVFRGQPAAISRRANPRPCGEPAALVQRSFRPTRLFGGTGRVVRVAQRRLGTRVSGTFDNRTWRSVKRYQRAHDLPVTGALDKPTWASLDPRSVRRSAIEGFSPRRAARYGAGRWTDLRLHRGSAGRPVAFLQTALRMRRADRNGLFGRRTAAKVRSLKAGHGLVRNAVVTPAVWRVLATRR
jgi:peptidoglycan hydrolase-like protein with peptidoglycan-binding domain